MLPDAPHAPHQGDYQSEYCDPHADLRPLPVALGLATIRFPPLEFFRCYQAPSLKIGEEEALISAGPKPLSAWLPLHSRNSFMALEVELGPVLHDVSMARTGQAVFPEFIAPGLRQWALIEVAPLDLNTTHKERTVQAT